ncbi:MAG: FHA domain-containing protein [Bacteroidales bacterium]|nr:FHA domain-containing protein [Bacteroidales bacterium]
MSSNKTIIPGMECTYDEQTTFVRHNDKYQSSVCDNLSFGVGRMNGNMNEQKPIVGFLYSISRSVLGEFWPLRLGANCIGRSVNSDICLKEATVSEQHAVLVVRKMKNPEKIIASICDSRSTCGTMINGESLGFDQRECFNGDIVTIGEHYDLYLILIDSKQIGIGTCDNFIPINVNNCTSLGINENPYKPPIFNRGTLGYHEDNATPLDEGTVGFDNRTEKKPCVKSEGTVFI